MSKQYFKLKEGMKLGVASAATQIEGGDIRHSWMDWYLQGHIQDGSTPARANQHYRLWREDAALMKEMGIEIYRLGVEWARIEPQQGAYDEAVIRHYKEEIKLLLEYGIQPLVTLHHFTNPIWFEEKGGFEKKENIRYFLRFVKKMVVAFGSKVNEYITLNEPNVYATLGYYEGQWPPGKKSMLQATKVMSVMAAAHIQAYTLIHKCRKKMGYTDTKVGFANHMRVFIPENSKDLRHCFFAKITEYFFQGSLCAAMYTGKFFWPVRNVMNLPRGRYSDFLGLNYYTRSAVKNLGDNVRKGVAVNDLNWEIYPKGIVECAKKLYQYLPLPIYITENGTCDKDDRFRSRYLYEHIREISETKLPVERYYHWCFCDNFEWIEGESARFGIVHVDYETQQRTIKESGEFFMALRKENGVDKMLYDKYVKDKKYTFN